MSEDGGRFEGLNLPQLLDLMHEIVMPEPISWMPETPGWWVLVGWLLAVCVLGSIRWFQSRRRNRYRRDSLELLSNIDPYGAGTAAQVATILKRTALVAYSRGEVASLTGTDWAEFLGRSAGGDRKVIDSASQIAQAAYREDIQAADILEGAQRWVKVHRA